MTNTEPQSTTGRNFLIGVFAGGMLGTALTLYFAPRVMEDLRARITDSARRLRHDVANRMEHVSTRIGDTLDQVTKTAQAVQAETGHGDTRRVHTPSGEL